MELMTRAGKDPCSIYFQRINGAQPRIHSRNMLCYVSTRLTSEFLTKFLIRAKVFSP